MGKLKIDKTEEFQEGLIREKVKSFERGFIINRLEIQEVNLKKKDIINR